MWIGRGDFEPNLVQAFNATQIISNDGDVRYLMGKGALGHYLSAGLTMLGLRPEER